MYAPPEITSNEQHRLIVLHAIASGDGRVPCANPAEFIRSASHCASTDQNEIQSTIKTLCAEGALAESDGHTLAVTEFGRGLYALLVAKLNRSRAAGQPVEHLPPKLLQTLSAQPKRESRKAKPINGAGDDELLQRIGVDPSIFDGKPIIRGRRLAVEHVLGLLAAGDTPDALLDAYDWLEPEDIKACLLYAQRVVANERVEPPLALTHELC